MADDLRAAMVAAGVDPGVEALIADGIIRRFCGPGDKPGKKNCWYILFESGAGVFGSWRLGIEGTVASNGNGKLTKANKQRIKASQAAAIEERRRLADHAVSRAATIWAKATLIDSSEQHPYLLAKGINPRGCRLLGNLLVVQVKNVKSGKLTSLQFIGPDGAKTYLKYGRTAEGYAAIADGTVDYPTEINIAEGYATACTVYEATGIPTAAAFSAGNLLAVAKALHKKYPKARIVICSDSDRNTPGNPGVSKATEAARAVRGSLAIPQFSDSVDGTDFNDLAGSQGLDEVRQQIANARKPADAEIPENFKLTKDTLYFLKERKTKDNEIAFDEYPVCSRLEVVALTRDDSGGEWGRLLHFKDPDGREHEWAMPTEMLAGDGSEYRARLLEQGLTIWPSRDARFGLHEYLAQCRPAARVRAVTRVGWHGSAFVLPDQAFGFTDTERTMYQSAVSVTHAFNVRGSLEDWKRQVATPCASNTRLIFAASTAFAASLVFLTGDESGGFHYVGRSSLGKTTALRVGGSVWGGAPAQAGYLRQWRATANGLEGVAALHCDTLLCLDELSEVGPRDAGNIAYMLANGAGKARAHRDGSARNSLNWRVLFLSSGEITLADKVREDGRQKPTAGQQVRILDIPAECGTGLGLFEDVHGVSNGQEFADQVKAATQSYYGTAGRAFLSEIAKNIERITETVSNHRNDFVEEYCPPDRDGQVLRAATRFGLVAAAGELATALQITGWEEGEATRAAGSCFLAWLARRGHTGPVEIEAGIEQVRQFFALHGESRFTPEDRSANGRPVISRAGFRKDGLFWVFPAIFRSEIAAGFDWHSLAAALMERGMMIAGNDRKIQRPVRNPEDGKTIRMVCFTSAVLADEEAPENTVQGDALR